jgi:hypothetical protein
MFPSRNHSCQLVLRRLFARRSAGYGSATPMRGKTLTHRVLLSLSEATGAMPLALR